MSKENKGFALSTLAVNNRKTVFLIAIIILFGGYASFNSMPKENFPEIQEINETSQKNQISNDR